MEAKDIRGQKVSRAAEPTLVHRATQGREVWLDLPVAKATGDLWVTQDRRAITDQWDSQDLRAIGDRLGIQDRKGIKVIGDQRDILVRRDTMDLWGSLDHRALRATGGLLVTQDHGVILVAQAIQDRKATGVHRASWDQQVILDLLAQHRVTQDRKAITDQWDLPDRQVLRLPYLTVHTH